MPHTNKASALVSEHTPAMTAGTEVVEFSPTEALNATMTVVGANLAAAAGASS